METSVCVCIFEYNTIQLLCVQSSVFSSCQPVQEICHRIESLNQKHDRLRILLHTDAAQALGKIRVDACELGVDYLTIVGHKVWNLVQISCVQNIFIWHQKEMRKTFD